MPRPLSLVEPRCNVVIRVKVNSSSWDNCLGVSKVAAVSCALSDKKA